MKDIYYYEDTTKTYIKKGVGQGKFEGMYLWQEVKRFSWFYVPIKKPFWLNDYGFTKLIRY